MGSLAATVGNGETNQSFLEHPATRGSHTTNGHTTNGHTANGHTTNGHITNGHINNGHITNGHINNGHINNGHINNGHINNGHTRNGHSINGHTANDNGTINGSLNGLSYPGQTPMAICGMACRLPGGIASAEELWEFLLAKKNARTRVPESRYNVSAFHSPVSKPGTVATEYGHFLDDSVDLGALDTSVFPLNRTELERSDPQQRLMLEVAREAFEDAGVTDWRGKTVGCYIGNYGEDWSEMFAKEPQQYGLHRITGTGDFVIANRLSYEFDIRGPSVTIRTACSSALICINEACAAIARGDCEAAIVGGLNMILAPSMTISETEQGVLSKDGSCKTFSADANGYARGEAVTAVFIKPLTEAIRDGNPVRAVIRAVTNNSDGKTPGISHPSTSSQETLMRRAYAMAGITDFGETAMVECHGTGTPIGDPIEANAVARVFGDRGVYIGSVKPNLGHTEGASGLVSLIKMVKALEHRTIPPQIRFTAPNPNIPFKEARLTVPLEPTPWPQDRLERVSLNSFGVGGSNAHIILESAVMHNAATVIHDTPEEPQLLLYSASSAKSLSRMIDNYRHWVEKNPSKVADLAYTLARKRDHGPHRAFAIANGGAIETVSPPASIKSGTKPPNIVMVFTGQGAQWPQMGRQLWQSNETFKASIQHLDQCLQAISGEKPQYSIQEELKKPAKKSRVSSAEISQPLCTAIQIALVDSLRALGIVPSAVVGHSSGEIAAAYASGALTASEAIMAAHHRGAVTNRQKRKGTMAAIGMSWRDTEKHLVPNVAIACDNSPKSVTISGDTDKVRAVVADIQMTRPEVLARLLQVDKAYHSYHMAEIGDDYASLISSQVTGKGPSNAFFFSSVTGKLLDGEHNLGSAYWRTNLESPVRFREAVTNLLNHEVGKHAVFIEIGPHSALAGPLRQIFTETSSPSPYLSAMIRNQDCLGSYLAAVGKLHSLNVNINLDVLFPTGSCLPDLPRYPWNHDNTCWYESRLSKDWRFRKFPYHDLLGLRVVESTDLEPAWRNLFHLSNTPWVHDHKIGDDIVFPFAGYIAMAGEAVRQTTGINDGFSIQNVLVSTALVLPKGKPTEMMTTFRPKSLTTSLNSSWWEFTMASYNGHIWTKHCTGEAMALTSVLPKGKPTEMMTTFRPKSLTTSLNSSWMFSVIEERWVSQGGREQDKPAILKEKLSLEEWKVVAAVQKILQPFKVASKQLQGEGIAGKRSTSGGFDEYFQVVEMLLDHLELAVQGVIIEENDDQIMEEVQLFTDMDAKTRRLLKVYIKLGWKKLNDYYGKLTSTAYVAAVVFHPCKKWQALERLWNQLPSRQTSEWKRTYESGLRTIWEEKYQNKAYGADSNAVSAVRATSTLDYIERRLAFSRSLTSPDSQGRQSKRQQQSAAMPAQDELDQYLSEPPVDNIAYKTDPIAWWRDVGAQLWEDGNTTQVSPATAYCGDGSMSAFLE
ncbi:Beta-ketoacyl synthase, partial [Metarhizium majus ARSEF 297]